MNLKRATKEFQPSTTEKVFISLIVGILTIAILLLFLAGFGWVFALAWNGFLVPVFGATVISWWQGSIAVLGIWAVIRVIELSKGK